MLLLGGGSLPDVLQTSGAAELLGEQRLELGTLDGAQQDHGLCGGKEEEEEGEEGEEGERKERDEWRRVKQF